MVKGNAGPTPADWRRSLLHETHVWIADPHACVAAGRAGHFPSLLSTEERLQWQSFHFARDQAAYLVAHGLLRETLSLYGETPPAAWRFRYGEHGKPAIDPIAGTRSLSFNLSHTDGAVAIIVAEGRECGIDVERIDRRVETEALSASLVAATEQADWRTTPSHAKATRFVEMWTLKEAYLKGTGQGIGAGMADIVLRRSGDSEARVFAQGDADAARWRLNFFHLPSRHVVSTAVREGHLPDTVVIRQLEAVSGTWRLLAGGRSRVGQQAIRRHRVAPPPRR